MTTSVGLIGLIGLGAMGSGMAQSLRRAGHTTAQLACLQPGTTPLTESHSEEVRTTCGVIW